MTRNRANRLLIGLLFLAFLLPAACQSNSWKSNNAAGSKALQQGRYADAEKLFLAALEEAKEFGPQDQRLATSLNNLASVYQAQGKYAEAEPLFKRALAIWEKALAHSDETIEILERTVGSSP